MKLSNLILAGVVGLVLQGTASAEIYESEDSEGVPEFSDAPTQGAEVVDLPATNLAEPPPAEAPGAAQESEPAPRQGEPAARSGEEGEGEYGNVYYGGDDDDDVRARRRLDEDRIDNALPGNPGPGRGPGVDPGYGVPGPGAQPRAGAMEGGEVHHEVHHEGGAHR